MSNPETVESKDNGRSTPPPRSRGGRSARFMRRGGPSADTPEDPEVEARLRQFALEVLESTTEVMRSGKGMRSVPYWTVYGMNLALFVVGLVAFAAALIRGFTGDAVGTIVFAGLSAASFATTFLANPLKSMQRNSTFGIWLDLIVNTYWMKVMGQNNPAAVLRELESIMFDAGTELERLARAMRAGDADATAPDSRSKPGADAQKVPKQAARPPAPDKDTN